jgi:peptide/nickel transport system substrate-binding protein
MSLRPARLIGPLVMVALLGAASYFWRSGSGTSGPVGSATGSTRGGELLGSLRVEPRTFNRIVSRDQGADLLNTLMHGRLVRINRATFELEPWLAARWESAADGLTHTLHLRPGVSWSDGHAFSSADVLFSVDAAARAPGSVLTQSLLVGGQQIQATAPDAETVVLTFAAPSGIGLRLLDQLPILPKHKLEAAFAAGAFSSAWNTTTPPSEVVGLGPFVLREYQPGQRVVLDRNPRYWRQAPDGSALPYLDRIVLEIVPDQNAEVLRLQSGAVDLTQDALRPEDFVSTRRLEQRGAIKMVELGVAEADAFWFCLKPEAKQKDPRFAFVERREFRQALSHAVDREAFAEEVFLGEAVPVWGPITPGNRQWFSPNVPRYSYDVGRAKTLLTSLGLEDRNGNGIVETADGTEARFTVITQRGLGWSERGTTVLRAAAAKVGIALDLVPLENGAMIQRMLACDYEAIFMRPLTTDMDPAGNLDFWLSSGSAHYWNLAQKAPATDWERALDAAMLEQAATLDQDRRHAIFNDAQRLLAENLPALHFAAPRTYAAHSARVMGVVPAVQRPPILWNADLLSVSGPSPSR